MPIPPFAKDFFEGNEHNPYARYLAFDICHSYFQNNKGKASLPHKKKKSILTLWGFLSAWGMMRRGSFLSQKNPFILKDAIGIIDKYAMLFDVDIEDYDEYRDAIIKCFSELSCSIGQYDNRKPSITLITKIMYGVYSCIPAIDINVSVYLNYINGSYPTTIQSALDAVKKCYVQNKSLLMPLEISTIDWKNHPYTRLFNSVRMVDMMAYTKGKDIRKEKRKNSLLIR